MAPGMYMYSNRMLLVAPVGVQHVQLHVHSTRKNFFAFACRRTRSLRLRCAAPRSEGGFRPPQPLVRGQAPADPRPLARRGLRAFGARGGGLLGTAFAVRCCLTTAANRKSSTCEFATGVACCSDAVSNTRGATASESQVSVNADSRIEFSNAPSSTLKV